MRVQGSTHSAAEPVNHRQEQACIMQRERPLGQSCHCIKLHLVNQGSNIQHISGERRCSAWCVAACANRTAVGVLHLELLHSSWRRIASGDGGPVLACWALRAATYSGAGNPACCQAPPPEVLGSRTCSERKAVCARHGIASTAHHSAVVYVRPSRHNVE